jgi:hypothetical protein
VKLGAAPAFHVAVRVRDSRGQGHVRVSVRVVRGVRVPIGRLAGGLSGRFTVDEPLDPVRHPHPPQVVQHGRPDLSDNGGHRRKPRRRVEGGPAALPRPVVVALDGVVAGAGVEAADVRADVPLAALDVRPVNLHPDRLPRRVVGPWRQVGVRTVALSWPVRVGIVAAIPPHPVVAEAAYDERHPAVGTPRGRRADASDNIDRKVRPFGSDAVEVLGVDDADANEPRLTPGARLSVCVVDDVRGALRTV